MTTDSIKRILNDWHLWPQICFSQPTLEQLSPLVDGLTNSNWLLEVKDKSDPEVRQYVIRINATNNLALKLNRQAEWDMHQSISQYGICPPFSYRDPNDIYWIRPFLKTHTLESVINKNKAFITADFLSAITHHFKAVHSTPTSSNWPTINYSELIEHYWQQIALKQSNTAIAGLEKTNKGLAKANNKKLSDIKGILKQELKNTNYIPCLCHMDPNPSNWILNKKQLHLIDWEYAALGNPAWDLAVFTDTCNLNQDQINSLLNHYQTIDIRALNVARTQMKYLSALWYTVQGHLTDNELLDQLSALQAKPT